MKTLLSILRRIFLPIMGRWQFRRLRRQKKIMTEAATFGYVFLSRREFDALRSHFVEIGDTVGAMADARAVNRAPLLHIQNLALRGSFLLRIHDND